MIELTKEEFTKLLNMAIEDLNTGVYEFSYAIEEKDIEFINSMAQKIDKQVVMSDYAAITLANLAQPGRAQV